MEWCCAACTYENPAGIDVCQVCEAPRHGGGGAAAALERQRTVEDAIAEARRAESRHAVPPDTWACAACTFENEASATFCECCESVRPAPTPPVASTVAGACVGQWDCLACTYTNDGNSAVCEVCTAARDDIGGSAAALERQRTMEEAIAASDAAVVASIAERDAANYAPSHARAPAARGIASLWEGDPPPAVVQPSMVAPIVPAAAVPVVQTVPVAPAAIAPPPSTAGRDPFPRGNSAANKSSGNSTGADPFPQTAATRSPRSPRRSSGGTYAANYGPRGEYVPPLGGYSANSADSRAEGEARQRRTPPPSYPSPELIEPWESIDLPVPNPDGTEGTPLLCGAPGGARGGGRRRGSSGSGSALGGLLSGIGGLGPIGRQSSVPANNGSAGPNIADGRSDAIGHVDDTSSTRHPAHERLY